MSIPSTVTEDGSELVVSPSLLQWGVARYTNERRMVMTIAAAVKSKNWQGNDGIISEDADTTENDNGAGFMCRTSHLLNPIHS